MTKVKKVPYYTMERSMFRRRVWKEYYGSAGAVPINTRQKVSYDRPPPGVSPLSAQPKPAKEQIKAQPIQEVGQKAISQVQNVQQSQKSKEPDAPKPEILDAEDKEGLPGFDLQDIPIAMEKIGWPVSARVARKWFASPKNIWNDDLDSVQPIDDSAVTLNWALKYGNVKDRFDELLNEKIYSERAISLIRNKILKHVTKAFIETQSIKPVLNLDATPYTGDLRQFHIDWQIQKTRISTLDTLDGLLMTDLSGTLGNFFLYAAIGRVEVSGMRYFNYNTDPYRYCIDVLAQLTHIYVYLKDNYSFNDKYPSNSQYLGHWSKRGMIPSYLLGANELLGQLEPGWKLKINSDKIETYKVEWDYLPEKKEVNKPVDTRRRIFGKFAEKDVYWPIYNKTYNEWRERHNRGGDFMIYSKPQLYKLKKPIVIKLDAICRPYHNTSTGQ